MEIPRRIKTAIGQYTLDLNSGVGDFKGNAYKLKETNDLWVMLLSDTSQEREWEVEKEIQDNSGGFNQPIEKAISKGKFVGYVYRAYMMPELESPSFDDSDCTKKSEQSKYYKKLEWLDSRQGRILSLLLMAVVFCVLRIAFFYPNYLSSLQINMREDLCYYFEQFSISGMLGCIVGMIVMVLLFVWRYEKNQLPVFLLIEGVSGFVAMMATDYILMLLIYFVVDIFPLLIEIAILVVISRGVWKKFRGR